jgi:hypothetical protein
MDNLVVAKPDSPTRCQAVTSFRQCIHEAVPGGKYCYVHGGAATVRAQEKKATSQYRVRLFQSRLDEKANAPAIKSLRDEIGILRITLEEVLNRCEQPVDVVIHAGRISDLTLKIEKLVSSCHSIEKSSGKLLDKSAILQFASEVVQILSDELDSLQGGKEILERVSSKIIEAIDKKE